MSDHFPKWKSCYKLFSVQLIDGTYARGRLERLKINGAWKYRHAWDWAELHSPDKLFMRRRKNGEWEYRPATPEETEDYNKGAAW